MELFYNPTKYFCGSPNELTLYFDGKEIGLKPGLNEVDEAITGHPDYEKLVEIGAFSAKPEPSQAPKTTRRKTTTPEPISLEG
jgi:hypothetical protein